MSAPTGGPGIEISADVVNQKVASFRDHVNAMNQAAQRVNESNADLAQAQISNAGTAYQKKIQEWQESYRTIAQKFNTTIDSLEATNKAFSGVDDVNSDIASSFQSVL